MLAYTDMDRGRSPPHQGRLVGLGASQKRFLVDKECLQRGQTRSKTSRIIHADRVWAPHSILVCKTLSTHGTSGKSSFGSLLGRQGGRFTAYTCGFRAVLLKGNQPFLILTAYAVNELKPRTCLRTSTPCSVEFELGTGSC